MQAEFENGTKFLRLWVAFTRNRMKKHETVTVWNHNEILPSEVSALCEHVTVKLFHYGYRRKILLC